MNSTKKNIRKTSGTRNRYKPGQLLTKGVQSLQRETELQMEHKTQVQVRSSPIQVNNVLNYQNYEHFREIAG